MELKPEEKVQYFLLIEKHQVDSLISLGMCRFSGYVRFPI